MHYIYHLICITVTRLIPSSAMFSRRPQKVKSVASHTTLRPIPCVGEGDAVYKPWEILLQRNDYCSSILLATYSYGIELNVLITYWARGGMSRQFLNQYKFHTFPPSWSCRYESCCRPSFHLNQVKNSNTSACGVRITADEMALFFLMFYETQAAKLRNYCPYSERTSYVVLQQWEVVTTASHLCCGNTVGRVVLYRSFFQGLMSTAPCVPNMEWKATD